MRAFVTGATGFLGRHLVRALRKRHDLVVELHRDLLTGPFKTDLNHPDNVAVQGDLSSITNLERVLAEYEIDTVFHLAAQTQISTASADPIGALESNVHGTWNVVEACRRQKVKRVLVASSDKAYADGPVPYCADDPLRPHGVYATSKACADFIAQSYAREYKMSIAVTRCGNLYGPEHTNWSTLIPSTIKSVIEDRRPRLRSDGKSIRDFLFVEDAVSGYLALAESDRAGAWNFGSYYTHGKLPTTLEVVQEILVAMESELKPIVLNETTNEIDKQYLDCSATKRDLGWSTKHTLKQGLAKTIPWYREHLR